MTERDLWGPIALDRWRDTPFVANRLAGEDDVRAGNAVFYLQDASSINAKPIALRLPRCAVFHDEQSTSSVPVILVQAEEAEGLTYIGYRYLSGGSGMCTLQELELLEEPDSRFDGPSC